MLARQARPCAVGIGSANPGPWTASWPFYRCENQAQDGPGPRCLARNSTASRANTQDPARLVRSGCWRQLRGSGGPGTRSRGRGGGGSSGAVSPSDPAEEVSGAGDWRAVGPSAFWQWRACFTDGIHGSVGRLGEGWHQHAYPWVKTGVRARGPEVRAQGTWLVKRQSLVSAGT